MAFLYPFRTLRPTPANAPLIASVPYDVVSVDEARALAEGNPLSFLRVSRAEIELAPDIDPYSEAVYRRASQNFTRLREQALVLEARPSLYAYRLRLGNDTQTGLAACFSLDEYDRDIIKKHERTRPDKEDDRTRHMIALGAQTGPVFLTYRSRADVNDLMARTVADDPLIDFEAPDGVRHTLWQVAEAVQRDLTAAFLRIPALYVADGHHRLASAARVRSELVGRGAPGPAAAADAESSRVLAVAFPHDQVRILPYNRIVRDLGGLTPAAFLETVSERFHVSPGTAVPARRGEIAMYMKDEWKILTPRTPPDPSDPFASLDVSVLQGGLLAPILGIKDVRTDKRIDFVGGARGTEALERAVASGQAAVAFSLFPVSVGDLIAVSDLGGIMPPKSTWFEPKLRDGLLIHLI
jgi:uncharacterized protein (DUF1015 family)